MRVVGDRRPASSFPRVETGAAPDIVDGTCRLGKGDFMSGATEDRYPEVFRQAQGVDGGGREIAGPRSRHASPSCRTARCA